MDAPKKGAGENLYDVVKPSGIPPGMDMSMLDPNAEQQASPQEQGVVDQFVLRAVKAIDNSQDKYIKQLNRADTPVYKNVAKTAVLIGMQVKKTAEESGQEVTPDILHNAGAQIIEVLMDLGDAAGIFPFESDDPTFEEQMNLALHKAQKIVGEQVLANDDGSLQNEAADFMAQQIAMEKGAGTMDENLVANLKGFQEQSGGPAANPVAAGVNQAVSQ